MAWSTAVGLVLAFAALLAANLLEGGNPAKLLNLPGGVIVLGGTLSVALISFAPGKTLGLPKTLGAIFKAKTHDHGKLIATLVDLADKARRQGLLALEEEGNKMSDAFMRKGIQLIVDGTGPEIVRRLLEIDTEQMQERHISCYSVLAAMGGYAPTMGIIGTVMGLVNVLGNMSDPEKLAESIATAFLATFYGVGTANLLWLPLASKLKQVDEEEVMTRSLMTEGILAIQAGDNPRVVGAKLEAFLSPKHRTLEAKERSGEGK